MAPHLGAFADAVRCPPSDTLCHRVHRLEPSLPLHVPFDSSTRNPCIVHSEGTSCLPAVHLLTGWQMLAEDAILPWLEKHLDQIEMRGSPGCFNLWRNDGGLSWVKAWPAVADSRLHLTVDCAAKLLTWHPEYAGRYWFAAVDAYEECRHSNATSAGSHSCDILRAHNQTIGTDGTGNEATPPFVLRALYGRQHVKIVLTLRNPVDRLETAFWFHKQFWSAKSPTSAGMHAYAVEQVEAFHKCATAHGTRRCAFLFERLGAEQATVFWHCNHLIRGLYWPFVAEWAAAFGDGRGMHVLRVEDLLDEPQLTGRKLSDFLGLAASAVPLPTLRSYASAHAASLNVSCCGGGRGPPEPMLVATRELLRNFYSPFNVQLARLLREPAFERWA